MNTILVPTNLTTADRAAFRYALDLAMHYNWGLHLVYVWPVAFGPGGEPIYYPSEVLEKDLDEFVKSSDLMQKEADYLEKTGFKKTVLEGASRPTQLGFADEIGASLIVIANPKTTGFDRALFGNIPADMARLAGCPVLLVPERAVFTGIGQIVFATDPDSLKATFLNRAIDLANEFGSFIQFLHVGDDFLAGEDVRSQLLNEIAPLHKPEHGWAFNQVEASSVERGLLDWLLESAADLVILSTHHRGFFDSLTHHSVTAGMIKKPFFPILVLHEEDPANGPVFDSIKDLRMIPEA